MDIKEYLLDNRLICDGAFGTFYINMGGSHSIAEQGNFDEEEIVKKIHISYLDAGARLIRTNTFASNELMLDCDSNTVKDNIRRGYRIARKAASNYPDVYVAGDIGPIAGTDVFDEEEAYRQYKYIAETFVEEGAEVLLFETFSTLDKIAPVISEIKSKSNVFIIVQFCVNQFGYSNAGRSARSLLNEAASMNEIDAVGLNCGVGPVHMLKIFEGLTLPDNKFITALPNAGYPKLIQNRMCFMNNSSYFAEKVQEIASLGINIVGGCCGTTPEYISRLSDTIDSANIFERVCVSEIEKKNTKNIIKKSFLTNKLNKKKLIAVELAPPVNADDEKIMDAANVLKNSGVDVITIPDSPSGRTRADSILMGVKIHNATGMHVMPHICCRDKNAIAIRAQILGAYMNDINEFLVVTGDPVPTMIRQNVRSVFNFDSVGLMHIISDMNNESFYEKPVTFGGVINYDKLNFDVEIRRVKKKMESGAEFFLTQPVFTKADLDKIRELKEKTGAVILCGIMPLVSKKNAVFIKNEMTGIGVTDEIVDRFKDDMSREESEITGVNIAKDIIDMANDFVDGFYFTFPFNRVYLLNMIMN